MRRPVTGDLTTAERPAPENSRTDIRHLRCVLVHAGPVLLQQFLAQRHRARPIAVVAEELHARLYHDVPYRPGRPHPAGMPVPGVRATALRLTSAATSGRHRAAGTIQPRCHVGPSLAKGLRTPPTSPATECENPVTQTAAARPSRRGDDWTVLTAP